LYWLSVSFSSAFSGGGYRGVLDDRLLFQHAQGDDVVLDLLKSRSATVCR